LRLASTLEDELESERLDAWLAVIFAFVWVRTVSTLEEEVERFTLEV
jgi:hypothetical protein